MYFVHYDEDFIKGNRADWRFCKCGRWLHKDFTEDIMKDNEQFCLLCVDKFIIKF